MPSPDRLTHAVVRACGRSAEELVGLLRSARPWLALAGGPGIGWGSDEFPVLVDDSAGQGRGSLAELAGGPDQLSAGPVGLVPVARPPDATPLGAGTGVVALRWFTVAAGDVDEFVDLSAGAWPAFERLNEARILGLFRAEPAADGETELLLATWYASLAEWERSRTTVAATEGEAAEAGTRFRRRRALTRRSVVRIGVPVPTPR